MITTNYSCRNYAGDERLREEGGLCPARACDRPRRTLDQLTTAVKRTGKTGPQSRTRRVRQDPDGVTRPVRLRESDIRPIRKGRHPICRFCGTGRRDAP
jgi:hypothetical protein